MKSKFSFYEILVFIAYGFYLLFGLLWLLVSFLGGNILNTAISLVVTATFAAQFYYRHKITNLILGILGLFFSIWMALDAVNKLNLMAKGAPIDTFARTWLWMCLFSMVLSGILMFSYTKLSFKDR